MAEQDRTVSLEGRVAALELDRAARNVADTTLNETVRKLERSVSDLDSKLDRRPSWAVTVYLTGVSSIAAGLLGALVGVHVH